jgi:hypothetical protein|tara:strand:- start:129 stop:338 length:210 start_codon:yes stop_codon:yes gene_type:complete
MYEDDEYRCEECGYIASEGNHHCSKYEPTGSQSSMEHLETRYAESEYWGSLFTNGRGSKQSWGKSFYRK